jgi:hypothetical protein
MRGTELNLNSVISMRGTKLSLYSECAELCLAYTQYKLNSLDQNSSIIWGESSRIWAILSDNLSRRLQPGYNYVGQTNDRQPLHISAVGRLRDYLPTADCCVGLGRPAGPNKISKNFFTKFKEVIFDFHEIIFFHLTCRKNLFPQILSIREMIVASLILVQ